MQAEPSPDKTPPPNPDQDPTLPAADDARGSDAEVIGASTVASTDLDFVDEALDALDQDDLERAEELAERLQSSDSSEQS